MPFKTIRTLETEKPAGLGMTIQQLVRQFQVSRTIRRLSRGGRECRREGEESGELEQHHDTRLGAASTLVKEKGLSSLHVAVRDDLYASREGSAGQADRVAQGASAHQARWRVGRLVPGH